MLDQSRLCTGDKRKVLRGMGATVIPYMIFGRCHIDKITFRYTRST